ncbi:hypothetical protein T06_12824 [Trichinella sp. T6]|nr:hypothetical protein T06_12824 [Trichinella sp. T6]
MIVQKAELNVSSAANGCPYAEGLFQETGLAQMPMKMVSGGSGGGRRTRNGHLRRPLGRIYRPFYDPSPSIYDPPPSVGSSIYLASPPPTTMSSSSSSSLVTIRRGQCCLRRPPVGRDSPAEPDCWALAMVNVAELLALRAVCPLSTGLSNEMKTEEEECTCDSTAVKKPNAIYIRDRREVSKERLERHHQRSAFRPMIGRNCSGRIERPDWSLTIAEPLKIGQDEIYRSV